MQKTDVVIVGSGCSGLYCALKLSPDQNILIITKSQVENSDSFLAQGGICMLTDDSDYDSYFEDTMRAGHYENDKKSVDIMIRSSRHVVQDLMDYGVEFQRNPDGSLAFTREGAHSRKRILFHEDLTGKEITSKLLAQVKQCPNITIMENTTMLDIISTDNTCYGIVMEKPDHTLEEVFAQTTILATGGIGGLYQHSTNFPHLTGDALAVALRHKVELENIDYIQIHPTTLYSQENRSFLISESVRGEGAKLYNKNMECFVDELSPRDVLTEAILAQMKKDQTDYVWEDLRPIPTEELQKHFPNIVQHCREMGYDVTRECIPVVPAQHYFMGGIKVDYDSKTSMGQLYAIGETACNRVHGKNRLASNSLLESLVFADRAAQSIAAGVETTSSRHPTTEEILGRLYLRNYENADALEQSYQEQVKEQIHKEQQSRKEVV